MDTFETNLLRLVASTLYFSVAMQASHELFGKSYFSLGVAEKTSVDQMVNGQITGNFQALKPDFPMFQTAQKPVGFQNPTLPKIEPPKSDASS